MARSPFLTDTILSQCHDSGKLSIISARSPNTDPTYISLRNILYILRYNCINLLRVNIYTHIKSVLLFKLSLTLDVFFLVEITSYNYRLKGLLYVFRFKKGFYR